MLPEHQKYAFKAEKLVANHLSSKGNTTELATTKDLQYKDIDLVCKCPKGREFTVSVKFMPIVLKTGNYAFETKQISNTGATMNGWFNYGESTYTVICIPEGDYPEGDYKMELAMWETKALKELVLENYHKKANLTNYQKSFNVGRTMNNTELLLVKREILKKYARIAIVQLLK